jgi:hypothetical protein
MTIREASSLQVKKSFMKWCQIFATHMEEIPKYKVPSIEDYAVLKEFEYVFKEVPGFPPKIEIDFSINIILRTTLVSKNPYRMSTPELKELQMQLEEIFRRSIYSQVCHLGVP